MMHGMTAVNFARIDAFAERLVSLVGHVRSSVIALQSMGNEVSENS